MWMQTLVTAAAAVEPISIEEARAQCQIEEGVADYDVELGIYIPAARLHAEAVTDQKLITQTVKLRCSCWGDLARLPVAPIASVASVAYLDTAGTLQTLGTTVWEAVLGGLEPAIRAKIGQAFPPVRPVADAIQVTAQAGYGTAGTDVAADIRLAMLLMIADWFANREDSSQAKLTEIPRGAMALLQNHRL